MSLSRRLTDLLNLSRSAPALSRLLNASVCGRCDGVGSAEISLSSRNKFSHGAVTLLDKLIKLSVSFLDTAQRRLKIHVMGMRPQQMPRHVLDVLTFSSADGLVLSFCHYVSFGVCWSMLQCAHAIFLGSGAFHIQCARYSFYRCAHFRLFTSRGIHEVICNGAGQSLVGSLRHPSGNV